MMAVMEMSDSEREREREEKRRERKARGLRRGRRKFGRGGEETQGRDPNEN